MNINDLINLVTKDMNNNWPTIYKIRYIYLKLGKYLSKDTDFFFSVEQKLGNLNLSFDELKDIYYSENGRNKSIICYSGCYLLKKIYEKLGIKTKLLKSKLIKTVDNKGQTLEIYHWFLIVYDQDKPYFLSISPDLPYIQEGMSTRHFAMNIPYQRELTNGKIDQVYEGEEIKPTLLTNEELRNIDKEIGYIKNYYMVDDNYHERNDFYLQYNDAALTILKNNLKGNRWYYQILAQDTDFYKSMYTFTNSSRKEISFDNTSLNDLKDRDINEWIKLLCFKVNYLLKSINGVNIDTKSFIENFNYNIWLENMCNDIYKIDNFDYNKWSKEVKNEQKLDQFDYNNAIVILDKTNALVNVIKHKNNGHFNELLNRLAYHFIDDRYIINDNDKNNYINNYYIAHKFKVLFPKIFSANELVTDFNNRQYYEQVVLIKDILDMMFPELNKKNSNIENYNDKYSTVANRIHTYTIKDKKTLKYSLVFNVVGNNNLGDYYFYYNLQTNEFKSANILEIYQNYIIVSDRFKSKLEEYDLDEDEEDIKIR